MFENMGAHDEYDGGQGIDTLQFVVTVNQAADLARAIAAFNAYKTCHDSEHEFEFRKYVPYINLEIENIENITLNIIKPVAVADTAMVTEGGPILASGNVLANDTDALSQYVTLSASLLSPAAGLYGDLVLNANGSYTYTLRDTAANVQALNAGDLVHDVFTYQVSDGNGGFSTATLDVKINGTNDAPIASVAAYDFDCTLNASVAPLFSDFDSGAVLTYALINAPAGLSVDALGNLVGVFGPSHVIDLAGVSVKASDGIADSATIALSGELFDASFYTGGTITGTTGNNELVGTSTGKELLVGLAGDDTIYGDSNGSTILAADDAICGDDGNDVLVGDSKIQALGVAVAAYIRSAAELAAPTVNTGIATTVAMFEAHYGNDTIYGDKGDDMIMGDQGGYEVFNNTQNIGFTAFFGHDFLYGGEGADILVGDVGSYVVSNIHPVENLRAGGNYLDGGAGDDMLAATRYSYTNYLLGSYTFTRELDSSTLLGGDGNDILTARLSENLRFGVDQSGNVPGVTFFGIDNASGSNMQGGEGNDYIAGGWANFTVTFAKTTYYGISIDGSDVLDGGNGNDTIIGDRNAQTIFQGLDTNLSQQVNVRGDDHLTGGAGNDILAGEDSAINTWYQFLGGIGAAQVGATVASGHGNFFGKDVLEGGLGDDLIWGGSTTTAGQTASTLANPTPTFNGAFTAIAEVSSAGTAAASDTFVFDVQKGWDRDILMDFNGTSANITVGTVDTDFSAASNSTLTNVIDQKDVLLFKGMVDMNSDNVLDWHDVDLMITSIHATSGQAPISAGGYFDKATRSYVDPSDLSVHTYDVQGASHTAAAYTVPDGKVEINFANGSTIIVADVAYVAQHSIADLYATIADANTHIIAQA